LIRVWEQVYWKFVKLTENKAYIDMDEYYLKEIDLLMGILFSIVSRKEEFV